MSSSHCEHRGQIPHCTLLFGRFTSPSGVASGSATAEILNLPASQCVPKNAWLHQLTCCMASLCPQHALCHTGHISLTSADNISPLPPQPPPLPHAPPVHLNPQPSPDYIPISLIFGNLLRTPPSPPHPAPPYISTPLRFTISEGNKVDWLGWSVYVGYLPNYGPRFWDMSFKGERIAYELSLQEAAAGNYKYHNHKCVHE